MKQGLCHICGRPASKACSMCGRPVCEDDLDKASGVCKIHKAGRRIEARK